jgi:hypothetical protein
MPSEREEMIGYLLARLDARDKLIAELQQQLGALKQAAPETATEHPSKMALAGRS